MSFSLRTLFEVFVPVTIVLTGYGVAVHPGDAPTLAEYLSFYLAKVLLTTYLRPQRMIAVVLYISLLLMMAAIGAKKIGGEFDDLATYSILMVFWLIEWYIVPSATFAWDLFVSKPPTLRMVLWRTTAEIVVLCPLVYIGVAAVYAILFLPV